jgi:hypothetical protein
LEAILNNPFRVLGLPPTASDKEIAKRVSELLIYAEMGKNVHYEIDFEFINGIDRNTQNIEEAAKRIENQDQKLFYSLLSFEFNDSIDLNSIRLLENNDFEEAAIILKEAIFKHSPIKLRASKILINISKKGFIKNIEAPNYSIDISSYTHFLNENIKLGEKYTLTSHEIIPTPIVINETKTFVGNLENFQLTLKFKWQENETTCNKGIGFILESLNPFLKNYLYINDSAIFNNYEQQYPWNSLNNRATSVFGKFLLKEDNFLLLKKENRKIELVLNDILIFNKVVNYNIDNVFLSLWNSQTVEIKFLSVQKLENKKDLSTDIEVNRFTFTHIKNLMIVYFLYAKKQNYQGRTLFNNALKLLGNLVNQNYINIYSKKIVNNYYEINIPLVEDMFIEQLYQNYKSTFINKENENSFSSLFFIQSFDLLSKNARKKIEDKVFGLEIKQLEDLIEETTDNRKNRPCNTDKFAVKLNNCAIKFFDRYDKINPSAAYYNSLYYNIISDKVANELLDCAISYYNNHEKNNLVLNETIRIIYLSANFAKGSDIRNRINQNTDILSKSNPSLQVLKIDFQKIDWQKYINRFSSKTLEQKLCSHQTQGNNIEDEIKNLLYDFNNGIKQVESLYVLFHKCNSKLSVLENEIGKDNLRVQKINSHIVTSIVTFFFEILSKEERALKGNNVIQEVEFIIILEKGLKLFELMNSYPMTPAIKERYERHFNILKAKMDNFENDEEKVKKEHYKTASNRQFSDSTEKKAKEGRPFLQSLSKQIIVIGICCSIFLAIYLISVIYNKSSETIAVKKESKWKGFQLTNGSGPYSKYFGEQAYDFNSDCWLKFINSNKADAIVCLENVYTGKTIRNSYIRAGTSYTMENIPTGTYKIKTFYGNDWNPHKTINNGKITGTFESNFYFSTSDKRNDWIALEDDGYTYSTGEITLYNVPDGNMQSRRISIEDFFK